MKGYISLIVFFLLIIQSPAMADDDELKRATYKNLETFANVLTVLQQHYVDEIDPEKIITGAINGMLGSLDPHSSYMSPEDFKELQEETKGSFSGIGIEITIRDGILTAVSPIEGTPAYKKGIKAGDQILRVNGELTKNITLMDAVRKLRGKKGTPVTITIHRQGWNEMQDIELIRDVIPLRSVKSLELEPGLLYVRITNFQASTTKDCRKALHAYQKKTPIAGLLLDLRGNPGGLLDQAVQVSDIFMDKGIIVSTKGRNEEERMVFEAHQGSDQYKFPMVVLVDGGSASGSEIVAGALQDHKRAIILGTPTFGKGSVQTVLPMPGGAGIRLTTSKYYTPSGDSIQATGIKPDMNVPFIFPSKDEEKNNVQQGLREQDLPHHFKNDTHLGKKEEKGDEQTEEQIKVTKRLAKDNQLRTGLIILKSLNIASHQ